MKKSLLVFVIAFALGFLTHALVFPDFLANGITDVSKIVLPNPTPQAQNSIPLVTKVTFDGNHFSRHNVSVQFSRYIAIVNTSPTNQLMFLTSNNPKLATDRGYGASEQVYVQMDKRGQFVVADKN